MTNMTYIASLAYKAAVLRLLLPEVNFISEQLRLPTPHPIQMRDVQEIEVSSPKFGFGGSVETTNFVFTYSNNGPAQHRSTAGYLRVILNKVKHIERFDLYPEWARTPSLIDSGGAHQLATQWLAAVGVDVNALDGRYPYQVEQASFWNQPGLEVYHPPGDTNKTMLPVFNVLWGDVIKGGDYPAQVRILGTTKELMSLSLWDFSLIRRPALVVTNAMELNNTDPPVVRHLQRPPQSPATNSLSTNAPLERPPPFRQEIK